MKRILTSVICSLVTINTALMADTTRPKLVVGIVVDQLRTDYIEYLKSYFREDGFRRLMDKGVYLRDVDFKVPETDAVASTGMIMTGNFPSKNGINSAMIYDSGLKRNLPALLKPGTISDYSPESLRLSTISDEIAIDGAGLGAIYSIAADPQIAILLSGHAGSAATWFNPQTGSWTNVNYYGNQPIPVNFKGMKSSLASRLDTMQWKPLLALDKYPGLPAQKRYYPFSYTFPQSDKENYDKFFLSGLGNREITDVAIEYLNSLRLGNRGDAIDMLNVAYSAAPFKYVKDGDYRLELEDTYLRLDQQIGRLFTAIDKTVGLDNAFIFLTSTGYYDDAVADDEKFRIPGGEFSYKKAVSLLNSYLSAMHGNADYVDGFSGNQLYLNHKTIEAKRLNTNEIIHETAQFLEKMSGIADTYTLEDIAGENSSKLRALKLMLDPKKAGDIYVEFAPGWTLIMDNSFPVVKKPVRGTLAVTPCFIMGKYLEPTTIYTPVDVTEIAPTVTRLLRIRSPNGVKSKGLSLTKPSDSKPVSNF